MPTETSEPERRVNAAVTARAVAWIVARFVVGSVFVMFGLGIAMTMCEPVRPLVVASWLVAGAVSTVPRALFAGDLCGAARGAAAGLAALGVVAWFGVVFSSSVPWLFWFAPCFGVASYLWAVDSRASAQVGAWAQVALFALGVAALVGGVLIAPARSERRLPRCGGAAPLAV